MKKLNHAVAVMAALLAVVGFNSTSHAASTPTPADTVFAGGKVYTVNDTQPWAEAVAVKDGKIIYVGDAAGAKAYIGKDTMTFRCSIRTSPWKLIWGVTRIRSTTRNGNA